MVTAGVVSAKVRVPTISAMARERLLGLLDGVWRRRLALVTAPAGCGKSTLLTQYAAACGAPVAWYQAECGDGDPRTFLAHLEAASRSALGAVSGPWHTEADAALALEGASAPRMLLVIDDLHALQGTPAEASLERLLHYLPPGVAVVAATRRQPAINLPRLRVASMLLEVDADALRFRLWEVERLFRDFYREQLRPEELAELTRRTEGWAAVLHLFHLATRDRPPEERRRTMTVLGTRLRLIREYLVRNVLEDLDHRTRRFVLWSSVVDRISGPLCDELLGSDGGERTLADLERRQLVSQLRDHHGWYRCHEVLRSHLETILVEEVGEQRVREHRRRGGALLEAAGAYTGALGAYCAGDDWTAAARLLGLRGERLVADPGWWIEYIPPAVVDEDPWVLLALARRHRAAGRCRDAVDVYRRAEARFGDASPAELCGRERSSLAVWLEVQAPLGGAWPAVLRAATMAQPLSMRGQLPEGEVGGRLARGLCELLAGHLRLARCSLEQVMAAPDGGHALRGCARVGLAVVTVLEGGEDGRRQLEGAAEEADRDALPWLGRLAREALAMVVPPRAPVADRGADEDLGWGRGLRSLFAGWGAVNRGEVCIDCLEDAASVFDALHAPVLECWARALLAVASVGRHAETARAPAERAEAMARSLGVPGARAVALAALAELDPAGDARVAATTIAGDCGLAVPAPSGPPAPVPPSEPSPAPLQINCLGGMTVSGGGGLDLGAIKPKARSLLRLLAMHAGRPVHREVIAEALWPEADTDIGLHNLHVAVSSLRQLLEPGARGGPGAAIRREGDAYRLVGAAVDLVAFESALAAGRRARQAGDAAGARLWLARALDLYRGELLAEEGPADWVVRERERYRSLALEAAFGLASICAQAGDVVGAVFACEGALSVDRQWDPAWRLLIELHERAGDGAAAVRARRRYAEVLGELGVTA